VEDYETKTKQGKIERRIYLDSGRFVIYGYESEGNMTSKYRIVLKGRENRSFFIIRTGTGKNIALDAEFEDTVKLLKDGEPVQISDLMGDK
jgi:hypothetical protein